MQEISQRIKKKDEGGRVNIPEFYWTFTFVLHINQKRSSLLEEGNSYDRV